MRKLIYYVATTMDGFIAGPDGGDPSAQPFPVTPDLVQFIAAEFPETLPRRHEKRWVSTGRDGCSTPSSRAGRRTK